MIHAHRRPFASISMFGVSYLPKRNPIMIAFWSIMFPGFGHYLINQYFRATLFTLTELFINTFTNVNDAILLSLCGKFEMAKSVTNMRWLFGYLAIFFFAIWDSYRSAIAQNELLNIAEYENERINNRVIYSQEIQLLQLKNPYIAAVCSVFFPGLGQAYNHRFLLAFYAMVWWWFYVTFSHVYESVFYFFMGNIHYSIDILKPHWLLFMPSVIGGSVYEAFSTAIEHNRLFKIEQRQHFAERYSHSNILIFGHRTI